MTMDRCAVCRRLRDRTRNAGLCSACQASYDRYAHDDASIMGVITWTARRAHRFGGRAPDREVATMQHLRDFVADQLGAVDYGPTIRFLNAAHTMLQRLLAADARARGDEPVRKG